MFPSYGEVYLYFNIFSAFKINAVVQYLPSLVLFICLLLLPCKLIDSLCVLPSPHYYLHYLLMKYIDIFVLGSV